MFNRVGASTIRGWLGWGPAMRRSLAALALVLAGALLIAIEVSSARGQAGLVQIGNAPRLPRGATNVGPEASTAAVSGELLLRPRDPQALEAFADSVARRGSANFGHYLKKGQFEQRFGPGAATIAALGSQLQADGVRVDGVSGDGMLVHFSGSAAHVESAFATHLERYRLANGTVGRVNVSPPALPSAIASSVSAVVGLDGLAGTHRSLMRGRASQRGRYPAATAVAFTHPAGAPKACGQARQAATEAGGLTDDEIANAYGATALYGAGDTGEGVHIGIFEEEPFLLADIDHFDSCFFGAAAAGMMSRLHAIDLEGASYTGSGPDGEALLDIEDVSAMAPGANIDVYENEETPVGEVSEIAAMVDEDRDQIITSSYGQPCEQEIAAGQPGSQEALNFLFEQGAAQGQTFVGAAGDSGSDSCEEVNRNTVPQPGQNPISTGELASQPFVLGVGGTTITEATQPVKEHVWNDGDEGGAGGGGISSAFTMPSWQRDATVPGIEFPGSEDYLNAASVERRFGYPTGFCDDSLPQGAAANTPCRLEPDVSAQADEYTGAVTVYSQMYRGEGEEMSRSGWITSGGTSSATPIWAGMLALADASPTCRSNPQTAAGVGFVSPLLYGIASQPSAYAASFNDITEGNIDQYGLDDGKVFPARTGYDLATGLGSPRMTGPGGSPGLAYYLCTYAASGTRPVVAALTPQFGSAAGGESVTVTGAGFEVAGKADVAGVQVGAWQASAASISVKSPTSLVVAMPSALDTLPENSPPSLTGAGPAPILVTLSDGRTSALSPGAIFQYVDMEGSSVLPGLTGIVPTGGNEAAPEPVTILGSGFTGAISVSFGGVSAREFTVLSDSEIRVTPPPYSAQTVCAPLPTTGAYAGENASNDICQVQVQVHGSTGSSAAAEILPPVEGTDSWEQDGALKPPPGCGCEVYPATTEYDYAPAPKVESVSTDAGPGSLASELGGTLITIRGRGLNDFMGDPGVALGAVEHGHADRRTLSYIDFEAPAVDDSLELEDQFPGVAYMSGTEIQLAAPPIVEEAEEATSEPDSVPVIIHTGAGESPPALVQYAGIPTVTDVQTRDSKVRLERLSGAADTGGTPLLIKGKGLAGQVSYVRFRDSLEAESEGTQYTVTSLGTGQLEAQSVAENPALADVQACTVTGCSAASRADLLYLFVPGDPLVSSLTPHAGSASGGTTVAVHGQNLGCPLTVGFGGKPARSFSSHETSLYCGSSTLLAAVSPSGKPGSRVPVTVTTLESYFTGAAPASEAQFTYRSK